MAKASRISSGLKKIRIIEGLGLAAHYLLRIAGAGPLLLCGYGIFDAWQALPGTSRQTLNLLLLSALLMLSMWGLRLPGALPKLARRLDRFRKDPRRTISCGLDMEGMQDQSPLQAELRQAALKEADAALQAVPSKAVIPYRRLSRLAAFSVLAFICTLSLIDHYPEATKIVWARIRNPKAEIAPWTSLTFHLRPENPSVIYGGDVQVSLEVEGRMPDHPVMLLTRIGGKTLEMPAYRESGQRYSQRLEQVTQPVDFAFSIGRLQTEWKPVDVQLLPKILRSELTLEPPVYSGRPARKYAFGSRVLKGLPGSEITLKLESNRPLSAGSLKLMQEGRILETVQAVTDGPNAIFTWNLDANAGLEIQLQDLLGNQMSVPLESVQQVTPDQPPSVQLHYPESFLLATPSSVIRLQGSASDDVGVSRVTLIRGMQGYIDRPKLVAEGTPQRRWTLEETLDLKTLGVVPGQTLEFYLEAVDHRPGGGRAGVSSLSRVQVISEEEYAATLRRTEQLAGFQERFYRAGEALEEVRKALEALQKEIDGNPTQESLRTALEKAAVASRNAEEEFRQQAEDFPIFELEEKAQKKLESLRDHFGKQAETLENLDPNDMALDLKVAQITGANTAKENEIAPDRAGEERFIKVGRLLEQAVEYQRMVERQTLLVRWFERYAYALPDESREMLQSLGDYQLDLKKDVEAWITETRTRAEALDEEDGKWKREVEEMMTILRQNQVEILMQDASDAAVNEKNREALRLAKEALAGMLRLDTESQQGEGNDFCELCKGEGGGQGENSGLSDSLQQLLNALRNRGGGSGSRPGSGGGGLGGAQNDGYWTRGSSPLHLPMQGPQRTSFQKPYGEQIDGNGGSGTGRGNGDSSPAVSVGHQAGRADGAAEPIEIMLEKSPPQYRKAIRTFFDLKPENQP